MADSVYHSPELCTKAYILAGSALTRTKYLQYPALSHSSGSKKLSPETALRRMTILRAMALLEQWRSIEKGSQAKVPGLGMSVVVEQIRLLSVSNARRPRKLKGPSQVFQVDVRKVQMKTTGDKLECPNLDWHSNNRGRSQSSMVSINIIVSRTGTHYLLWE